MVNSGRAPIQVWGTFSYQICTISCSTHAKNQPIFFSHLMSCSNGWCYGVGDVAAAGTIKCECSLFWYEIFNCLKMHTWKPSFNSHWSVIYRRMEQISLSLFRWLNYGNGCKYKAPMRGWEKLSQNLHSIELRKKVG